MGYSFLIKVHFINIPPNLIRQEISHVFSILNCFSDEGRRECDQWRIDPADRRMIVERSRTGFRSRIQIYMVPAEQFLIIFPFMEGREVIASGNQNEFLSGKFFR